MARTAATLGAGTRISDFVTVGFIARTFPLSKVPAPRTQKTR